MFSKRVNRCHGDGFMSVGAQTGTIKLVLAGTQDWWRRLSLEHAESLVTKQ